ncbi:MAG: hypothetical protein HYX85_00300 [Chloroflexi bacterium]|nr:hypothetical protein [Chloroflexota bacterium]
MKRYAFKVELIGYGEQPEDAWDDAVEGFAQEPGDYPPEEYIVEEVPDDTDGTS